MSDLSVTERRIRPIIELIENRSWKQALQQCEKWQKKGEKSDRFLVLKASILVNQLDKAQQEKGKTEILQLCHRNQPVTDIEALYQLQGSLKQLSLHHEEGPKLWERAMAAKPNDKELLTTLLNGSVRDGDWMSAQKAAMALRKAFPKERQYDVWNMLLCHLVSQDRMLPQKDRDVFGRLGYMLISKAAEAVTVNKGEVSTSCKALATPEELALLIKIYNATGHADEALQLLQSEKLGIKSRIGDLDPQFTFSLLLDMLNASQDHEKVFDICKDLIVSGSAISESHAEDDRVWKTLSRGKDSEKIANACKELAENTFKSDPKCRTAYLAFFELAINSSSTSETDEESLVSACIAHYKNFSEKPFCFGDLVSPLQRSKSVLNSFLSQVDAESGTPLQRAFYYKVEYATLWHVEASDIPETIFRLARNTIKCHKALSTDKSECPEMLLLAASSLLHLSAEKDNNAYALQANNLLYYCYRKFSEYYPAAVRLIQLCLTQGQVSLAMDRFASLAVKNMQWETFGHMLLTRMSTIHPWPAGNNSDAHNPLSALDAGLNMLHNGDRSLDKAINTGLEHGSYSNIINSVAMKDDLSRSMNRQIFIVEERRIQRTVGMTQDYVLDAYPAEMVDKRDFSFLPHFGVDETHDKLEQYLTHGPLPKKLWLLAMALQDHVTTYLKAEVAGQTAFTTACLDSLKATLDKCQTENSSVWTTELTEDEISSLACHCNLANADVVSKEPQSSNQKVFDEHIDFLKTWLNTAISTLPSGVSNINGVSTPTWKFLHQSHTTLETLQTVNLFLAHQTKRTKNTKAGKAIVASKDKLMELQQLVGDAEKVIHAQAKKLKDEIGFSGVLGKLVDAALGRIEDGGEEHQALHVELSDVIDEVAAEEYCALVRESWEDALNGVLKIKIRLAK